MTYLLIVCATVITTGVLITLLQAAAARRAQATIRECVEQLRAVQLATTGVQKCFVQSSPYWAALEEAGGRLDEVLDLLEV